MVSARRTLRCRRLEKPATSLPCPGVKRHPPGYEGGSEKWHGGQSEFHVNVKKPRAIQGDYMRLRVSILTLVCSAWLITSSSFSNAVSAATPQGSSSARDLTSLVTQLELVVFGSTRKSSPLAERIRNLEIHAMCQAQTGTLKNRVDKLVQEIGLSTSPSQAKSETESKKGRTAESRTQRKAECKTATPAPPFAPPIGTTANTKPHDAATAANHSRDHHIGQTATRTAESKAAEVRQALLQGIKLHQDGKLSDAEVKFKQVLRLEPYNADACFSLGSLAESKGDLAGALGFYSTAALANPNDREARDAVLQVQEHIAQQQGPFVNPLSVAQAGSTPLLQARASEFTAAEIQQQGLLYPQAPAYATLGTPTFPSGSIRPSSQPVPTLNVGQNPQPRPSTGKAVARGLARVAVGAALNYSGLHCPLCNILRGF